jgi:alpha 1,3-glucosidase
MWDRSNFGKPEEMQDALAAVGRQLVVIVDPHIKRDANYYVYKEAQDLDILSKQADGKSEYEGWCWPGSSSWTDFFNPVSWDWWNGLFKFNKFIVGRVVQQQQDCQKITNVPSGIETKFMGLERHE